MELFAASLGLIFIVVVLIFLIPYILYLITLQNTLKEVSPQNRSMRPGQVWLMLIPLFNIVYQFFMVRYVAESIEKELNTRGAQYERMPTYSIGLAYCILGLCSNIPRVGGVLGLAALVCWIIHWVKVAQYKNKLQTIAPDTNSQIFNQV